MTECRWLEKAQISTKSRIYVKQHGRIEKRFSVLYYFQIYFFGMTVTAASLFYYCCCHSYRGQQRALNAPSGLNTG